MEILLILRPFPGSSKKYKIVFYFLRSQISIKSWDYRTYIPIKKTIISVSRSFYSKF